MTNMDNLIFVYNRETKGITFLSQCCPLSKEEVRAYILKEPLLEGFIHPEFESIVNESWEEMVKGAQCSCCQVKLREVDGKYEWYQLILTRLVAKEEVLGILQDISKEKEKELHLQHLADTDNLTGMDNRESFKRKVNQAVAKGKLGPHAYILVDIDNFKKINDSHGHLVGDEVLKQFAHVAKEYFPQGTDSGRLGGDEFILFLYNCPEGAKLKAHLKGFGKAITEALYQTGINLSVSMGVAIYPKQGSCLEELYRKADQALYRAKDNGKDSIELY
ncbi:MAG: GGDEF domain-containing protein [Anaerovoracaceae bacterium]